jgi:ABC-type multidrug transport system ATPase subunit
MTTSAAPRHAIEPEYAVVTTALRKTYRTRRGRQVAVENLELRVPRGGVHGFLGPNGSGKTTTIRMLLGLIRADSGSMSVFGQPVPHQLPQVIGSIGAIVEQPKFFPAFSGRRNLELLAAGIGAPRGRVADVLAEVGLAERARDRFKTYSLGMRQRLAIAATLLKEPELLIFDEPTNGLDPAGIHEVRATMRGLADAGRTVLVSSHILSEVQQVADTVSIIGRGRLLAEGQVDDILARGGAASVRVGVPDPARAAQLLTAAGFRTSPGAAGTVTVSPGTGPDGRLVPLDGSRVTQVLAEQGIYLAELAWQRADLEQVFLSLTAQEHLGANVTHAPPPPPTPPAQPRRGGDPR